MGGSSVGRGAEALRAEAMLCGIMSGVRKQSQNLPQS